MKRLILLIAFLLLINSAMATSETNIIDDTFQVNTIIKYSKPCFYNGTFCSSNAVCNYTILYPNNSILLNNQQSTNQISFHNITFTPTEIGVYTVNQVCYDQGSYGSETYYFITTSTGEIVGLSNIILVIAFLVLSVIVFFIGNTFNSEQFIIKTSFYIMSVMFGLLAINSARIIASESSRLNLMSQVGLILSIVIFLFLLLLGLVYWTIQTIKQVKDKKAIRWNY